MPSTPKMPCSSMANFPDASCAAAMAVKVSRKRPISSAGDNQDQPPRYAAEGQRNRRKVTGAAGNGHTCPLQQVMVFVQGQETDGQNKKGKNLDGSIQKNKKEGRENDQGH